MSTPVEWIGESMIFAKKTIGGGFCGIMGGKFGGKTEEDDEMMNESERIMVNPLLLQGLQK